jgi:uncharacterized membrane protein
MNDFPAELKKDWTRQDLEIEILTRRLRRGAIYWRVLLIVGAVAGVIGVAAGIWFAWIAVRQHDLLHALAAVTMLAAIPPAALAEFRTRRDALQWHDSTPEGVIRHALQRVDATTRLLRITFINGLVLIGLAAIVWVFVVLGLINQNPSIVLITLFWIGFGLLALVWVRWRSRANIDAGERCQLLLREYAAAEDDGE